MPVSLLDQSIFKPNSATMTEIKIGVLWASGDKPLWVSGDRVGHRPGFTYGGLRLSQHGSRIFDIFPGGVTVRRYHHIGIPTDQSRPGERHIPHLKIFLVGHEKSDYGVEWMRFEADAAVPELVRQVPHVAFEVSDLAAELAGKEILIAPNSPSDGVRVAFIVENGAPIELMEFTNPDHPDRR